MSPRIMKTKSRRVFTYYVNWNFNEEKEKEVLSENGVKYGLDDE
jgi:hypothetical protein